MKSVKRFLCVILLLCACFIYTAQDAMAVTNPPTNPPIEAGEDGKIGCCMVENLFDNQNWNHFHFQRATSMSPTTVVVTCYDPSGGEVIQPINMTDDKVYEWFPSETVSCSATTDNAVMFSATYEDPSEVGCEELVVEKPYRDIIIRLK
ncbi:MAG: hypothetical protein F6K39_04950 [Okeania sp. SIO3B3]|nr:hypothetical protein [Okeania sp. SIO3B3]